MITSRFIFSILDKIILFALLFLSVAESRSQTMSVYELIKAWRLSDTSQTHSAEVTYEYLKSPEGKLNYPKEIKELYQYLEKNPDDRLTARVFMYEILGKNAIHIPLVKQDTLNIEQAFELAHRLKDDQLKAEIYALQGQMNLNNNYLFYNLKALALQKKIGLQHFSYLHNRFFSISFALHGTRDFRQSINYGLQCLALKNTEIQRWDPRVYIFQLDIIGAAYKKLGINDSTIYYYRQILDTLYTKPDKDPGFHRIWVSIAKGNIGYALMKQHKYEKALPLILAHLQMGIDLALWNNAAMAQNALSEIWFRQKKYGKAIEGWKKAYTWALKGQVRDEAITATESLSTAYRLTKNYDSAFVYNTLYHKEKDSLNAFLNKERLSAVSARISFDNALNRLEKTSALLSNERTIRNFILTAIFLLTIIAILVNNRRKLKERIKTERLIRLQKHAEQETEKAKESLAQFTTHIIKKDQLINELRTALSHKTENYHGDNVTEQLLKYTLITNQEWEKFKQEFARAYPLFLPALKAKLPNINPAEERLASLIYLRLNSDQIASMLGIGKESVGRSKRRLKKRLNLSGHDEIDDFIMGLQYS